MNIKTIQKFIASILIALSFLVSVGSAYAQQTTIRPLPISTFTGLRDTPNSYTGDELDLVRVNAAGTALEFFTGSSSFASTLATVSTFSDTTAKSLYQMTSGANVEFRASDGSTLTYWDDANKRFGVGTNNIRSKFEVLGAGSNTIGLATSIIGLQSTANSAHQWGMRLGATSGELNLDSNFGGVDVNIITFQRGGNIGIGTNTPARKTTIVDATDASLYIRKNTTTTGDYAEVLFQTSTSDLYATAIRSQRVSTGFSDLLFLGQQTAGSAYATLYEMGRFTATGNLGLGTGSTVSAKLHVTSITEQLRIGYNPTNYFNATIGSAGDATLNLVSSTAGYFPTFTFSDRIRGTAGTWITNSLFAMGGQGLNDMSMTGLFDRNELVDSDLKGSITVNITGAGTNSAAQNAFITNSNADFGTVVSGLDGTTTQVEIIVDTGSNQANYSAAVWQPFLMTRGITQGTYANSINVEVSTDGVSWFQGSGWSTSDFQTDSQFKNSAGRGTLWLGSNSTVSGLTGSVWRYARFTLSNFVIDSGYPSNGNLWISQIGIRHYAAPMAKQYLNVRGANTTYGNFTLGTGNLSLVTGTVLPQSGTVSAPSYGFLYETNSGWYRSGAGVINLSVLGTSVLSASSSALTSTNVILAPSGTVSAPSFAYASETNSGWYRAAAGTMALSISGTQKISVTATETRSDNNILAGAAGSNLTVLSTTPRIQGVTTSGIAISSIGVADGTNNRRIGMYVNQTSGELGISYTRSSGAVPFYIKDVSTNRLLIDVNGNVGINLGAATTADTNLHVLGTGFPVGLFERQVTNTNSGGSALGVRTTSTGDMVDGFGTGFTLQIEDNAGVANPIANFFATRNGADNTGKLAINVYNGGSVVEAITALNTGSIGMGASPDASAQLDVTSTTKGFLPPRMTGAQGEAIATPATGLMIYATSAGSGDITAAGWWGYNGANWVQLN